MTRVSPAQYPWIPQVIIALAVIIATALLTAHGDLSGEAATGLIGGVSGAVLGSQIQNQGVRAGQNGSHKPPETEVRK